MIEKVLNVLFQCTGNSARSIMVEAILNMRGKGKFSKHNSGGRPKGNLNLPAWVYQLRKVENLYM